jgi:hypothetical protein
MIVTNRNILYALAATVGLFIVGAVISGVWNHNDIAGNITVTLWAISIIGVVILLPALTLRLLRVTGTPSSRQRGHTRKARLSGPFSYGR